MAWRREESHWNCNLCLHFLKLPQKSKFTHFSLAKILYMKLIIQLRNMPNAPYKVSTKHVCCNFGHLGSFSLIESKRGKGCLSVFISFPGESHLFWATQYETIPFSTLPRRKQFWNPLIIYIPILTTYMTTLYTCV